MTENSEKKVTLNTSYSCPSCASGAEKYSELFKHGTCVNCGAPLEQFQATLTEKGEQEIKASVFLLYSQKDMAKIAENVTSELKQKGIGVVDAQDVIDGSKTSVVSANLSYVMNTTACVLVIPSEHLEDDPAISTCLSNAILQKIERGSKNIVPIFTAENISERLPFGLGDIMGIDWNGDLDNMRALDKDRSLDQLHRLVKENLAK